MPGRSASDLQQFNENSSAVIAIGRRLRQDGYHFVTPTPSTHRRVIGRGRKAQNLRDIFGWNLPFSAATLPAAYWLMLQEGGLLIPAADGCWRAQIRFSSLDDLLLAHSPFPTDSPDAVFFGPDTYRFARALRWIAGSDPAFKPAMIADIGSGTGAGGFCCARLFAHAPRIFLLDINEQALEFSRANAAINGLTVEPLLSDLLGALPQDPDLIVSNPPYLVDAKHRAYRDGGGAWGCELPLRIVKAALERLRPGGKLLLYTGTPIVEGRDIFYEELAPLLRATRHTIRYEEIDPDVFGEELENPPYDRAERIANTVLFVETGS